MLQSRCHLGVLRARDKHPSGMAQGIAVPAVGHGGWTRGLPESPARMQYRRGLNGGKKYDGFKFYFKVFEQRLHEVSRFVILVWTVNDLQIV